jgi:hypothetical protein
MLLSSSCVVVEFFLSWCSTPLITTQFILLTLFDFFIVIVGLTLLLFGFSCCYSTPPNSSTILTQFPCMLLNSSWVVVQLLLLFGFLLLFINLIFPPICCVGLGVRSLDSPLSWFFKYNFEIMLIIIMCFFV